MPTFDDLGIPFSLFTAPVSEATEYRGEGICQRCVSETLHTFEDTSGTLICYECLRSGRGRFTKFTVNQEALG